jgi:hypothetical protein
MVEHLGWHGITTKAFLKWKKRAWNKQEERGGLVVNGILKSWCVHEPFKRVFFVLKKLGTCTFRRII